MTEEKVVNKGVFGIHHVTAITSDPQRNIDFYTNNLGLRFVKLTVNQDYPTSYHLYYGDGQDVQERFSLSFIGLIYQEGTEEPARLLRYLF